MCWVILSQASQTKSHVFWNFPFCVGLGQKRNWYKIKSVQEKQCTLLSKVCQYHVWQQTGANVSQGLQHALLCLTCPDHFWTGSLLPSHHCSAVTSQAWKLHRGRSFHQQPLHELPPLGLVAMTGCALVFQISLKALTCAM